MFFDPVSIERRGNKFSAIPICSDTAVLPVNTFQGSKTPGYIASPDSVTLWFREELVSIDGKRAVCTSLQGLKPASFLFDKGLSVKEKLILFKQVSKSIVQLCKLMPDIWIRKSFPLPSLLIIPDRGVLILPEDISSIMGKSFTEEMKRAALEDWLHPDIQENSRWIYQLISMFYCIITGTAPFSIQAVRETGFNPLPPKLFNPILQPENEKKLVRWLNRKDPLPGPEEFICWIEQQDELPAFTLPDTEIIKANIACSVYLRKLEKNAGFRAFLRKKSSILAAAAVISAAAFFLITPGLIKTCQLPGHAGWPAEKVVEHYYEYMDAIRIDAMGLLLSGKARKVRGNHILHLYISNIIQEAHGIVFDQNPAGLPDEAFVYGITNLNIIKLDSLYFKADYILRIPEFHDSESGDLSKHAGYRFIEHLFLEDRGSYYMINDIQINYTKLND